MDPSQVALLPVTFIEERNGKALVRLPNGSKTSVQFDALDVQPLWAHFVVSRSGSGVTVYCGDCRQGEESPDWPEALVRLRDHYRQSHPDAASER